MAIADKVKKSEGEDIQDQRESLSRKSRKIMKPTIPVVTRMREKLLSGDLA